MIENCYYKSFFTQFYKLIENLTEVVNRDGSNMHKETLLHKWTFLYEDTIA